MNTALHPTQASLGEARTAISALLETYFEGLHTADSTLLARVFHPCAHYVSSTPGDFRVLTFQQYQHVLDLRIAPAKRGETRQERVLSIELGGPAMAFVTLEMQMLGRLYTDFLTLVFDQGRWAIIAKVFHYTVNQEEA